MEVAPFDHASTLLACARGEQAAFHRLYDQEAPYMLALARRLVPGDAEGLVHDTFTLIWRNADQYDHQMGSGRAWIYSVLRHLARTRRIRQNAVAPLVAPPLPPATAVRGRLAQLAAIDGSTAYETVAHAYLHGADYTRVSTWLRVSANQLRRSTRAHLKELTA